MKKFLVIGIMALSWGCANTGDKAPESTGTQDNQQNPTFSVTLNFQAKVGTADFACGSNYSGANGVGTSNSTMVPRDFRFYVHDIRLVKSDNTEVALSLNQDGIWQYQNVALLDFENGTGDCANTTGPTAATNSQVKGTIPQSGGVSFAKIRFRLGVPASLNHVNVATATAPLNISALYWNWTTGYKFARLDFRTSGGAYDSDTFNIHLGSTNCNGTNPVSANADCANGNRPAVELNIPAAAQTDLTTLANNMRIVADVRELVKDLDLAVADLGGPKGCMSGQTDPECRRVLTRFGLQYSYTGTTQTGGGRDATNNTVYAAVSGGHSSQVSAQSFFRAE
ncbi:MAG: metallo-mystery pair system four-Cys motif protein [Leptospiraceae bacterium]|nr:metallo-mystery pair system four-Cys motif protein [Leptospiraceae bacterium]